MKYTVTLFLLLITLHLSGQKKDAEFSSLIALAGTSFFGALSFESITHLLKYDVHRASSARNLFFSATRALSCCSAALGCGYISYRTAHLAFKPSHKITRK